MRRCLPRTLLVAGAALALLAAACTGATPPTGAPPTASPSPRDSARPPEQTPDAATPGGSGPARGDDTASAPSAADVAAPPDPADVGAGASDAPDPVGGPGDAAAGPSNDVVVTAFQGANIYFVAPMDNHRHGKAMVDFPAAGPWKKVLLRLKLRCPSGKCDIWDRWGYLGIVNGQGMTATVTEIARFATPYGVGADWTLDVTNLQALLKGQKPLEVFIDTWVGPGHPQGNGWLVDASFSFTPGTLDLIPSQVIPLWDVASLEVGDPSKPPMIPARKVQIPAEAAAVELRSLVTGHGQGNLDNCAEFCPKKHSYGVAGADFSRSVWRTDCATTAVRPQGGRFPFASRAGWCPGALVVPWIADVTQAAKAGAEAAISYAPESYENTCRPGAPTCKGCLGASCAYDDGGHTAPNYVQSAVLVIYTRAAGH